MPMHYFSDKFFPTVLACIMGMYIAVALLGVISRSTLTA